MTYRYVPANMRFVAQLSTLLITGLIGVSILVTPPMVDPKLSEFERAMGADTWAWLLIVFGFVGFVAELVNGMLKRQSNLFWVVSLCHLVLMALMISYGASAMVGLARTGLWYNFAAPLLAAQLALWHYVYIQRRRYPSTHEMKERYRRGER
jgi:predicted MFS family arabinose efflux permease